MPVALLIALLAAAPGGDPVIAEVGVLAVRASDVRRHLAGDDPDALASALREAIVEAALAGEARAELGDEARGLSRADAAERLVALRFDPRDRCGRLPEPELRRRYEATRWRFVAPPAFVVDDLQLLCCTSPRACQDPDVAACLRDTTPAARRLRERLPDALDAAAFAAAFDQAAPDAPRLGFKRYTFYFDPARPDAPVDPALQQVDRPIADAAAALPSPGALSPVVATRFGHHILRLVATRPALDLGWDDPRTRALLATELCPERLAAERDRFVADLLAPLGVIVRRDALRAAFPELTPPSP